MTDMTAPRYPIIWTGKDTARLRSEEGAGTIADPPWDWRMWRMRVDLRNLVTPAAATSQAIDLTDVTDITTARSFPTNVWTREPWIHVAENVTGTGITDSDAELGDAGDDDGLVTISPVFSVAPSTIQTSAAAQFALRPEAAFVPLLTVTLMDANMTAVTTGIIDVFIPYAKQHPSMF